MNIKTWNKEQITEIISDENRYFFWLKYGQSARSFTELFMFYNDSGGSVHFAKTHKGGMNEK